MREVLIVGNGIAGITAARHIRKRSDFHITVVSSETEHFFSRTALMYIFMGHMKFEHTKPYEDHFWKKNNINLLFDRVESFDFQNQSAKMSSGSVHQYDELVIATGSTPNKFGWPGQDLDGVQGLYSYQDLELLEKNFDHMKQSSANNGKPLQAVISGGGLIGVELAEMLLSRKVGVHFLVREKNFWGNVLPPEEAVMIGRHMVHHGVELIFEDEIKEMVGHEGRVSQVITKSGRTLPCQLVGLTVGVRPNVDFLRNSGLEIDKGILVDNELRTNIPHVYAIGDCCQLRTPLPHRRAIEAVWYVGRMMGETVAATITGTPTMYQPGMWFNSAKFFDIEYQTYGDVPSNVGADHTFVWQHPVKDILFRVVFDAENRLEGINVFGIRIRHEVADKWIREKKNVDEVIANLHRAVFDAEFSRDMSTDIRLHYNQTYQKSIQSTRKSKFFGLLKR